MMCTREGPITLAAPPALLVEDVAEQENELALAKPANAESEPAEIAPPLESPPLFEPPKPVAAEKIVLDEAAIAPVVEEVAKDTAKVVEPVTPVESGPELVGPAAIGLGAAAVTDVASNVPPATSPYAKRHAPDRLEYAERHGGSIETEAAVAAALKWLAETQSEDGRWDASRFGAGDRTGRARAGPRRCRCRRG